MTIKSFINDYNLHDSLINNVTVDVFNKTVECEIDFAFWMQKDFKEGDPETRIIKILFSGVADYHCPSDANFEQSSILGVEGDEDTVKFMMLNDFTDESFWISIKASEVTIN